MSNWWTGLLSLKVGFSDAYNGEPCKIPARIAAPIKSKRLTAIAEVLADDAVRKAHQNRAIAAEYPLIEPEFDNCVRLRAHR